MSKIRVYELAEELQISSKELIELLVNELSVDMKSHVSAIEDEDAELVRELIGETGSASDRTIVDEYEEVLTEEVNNQTKRRRKKKSEEAVEAIGGGGSGVIEVGRTITAKELAEKLGKPAVDVVKTLIFAGVVAAVNQEIDFTTTEKICEKYEYLVVKKGEKGELEVVEEEEVAEEDLVERPPIVTVTGHVGHGRTSLLDAIKKASVTAHEAGGMTRHIGAYTVDLAGEKLAFLDTPGHGAFTTMRAGGAQVTDVVILIVAADDDIVPQTEEAISHYKVAEVPMIVTINKIDRPGASIDRVKQELVEYKLTTEDWDGDTICAPVSTKTGENLEQLLEMVLLTSEMGELRAGPKGRAKGTVIEAKLDKDKGVVTTLLIQNGALHVENSILIGSTYSRIRAMFDDKRKSIKAADPSIPVKTLGLSEVPSAGGRFAVAKDEKTARNMVGARKQKIKDENFHSANRISLEDLYDQIQEGTVKELGIIVKAGVQGSVQAIKQSLEELSTEDVRVRVIHGGVNAMTETDVTLATASNALLIRFDVRSDSDVTVIAGKEGVGIKAYGVIYDAMEDVKSAVTGILDPEYKEVINGKAEVKMVYKISNIGIVAGCYITDGRIIGNSEAGAIRDGMVIFESTLASPKGFKDDAKGINTGYECGLSVEESNDLKEGDVIESFSMQAIERKQL